MKNNNHHMVDQIHVEHNFFIKSQQSYTVILMTFYLHYLFKNEFTSLVMYMKITDKNDRLNRYY